MDPTERLASTLLLGALLDELVSGFGGWDLVAHWKQGEFHHDVVLRVGRPFDLPGCILVVSTNCNGGIKEVLCFAEVPQRSALWHRRCPAVPEFFGEIDQPLAESRTVHWFDPCELLAEDARSELRAGHRRRQEGGGWEPIRS